MFLSMRESKAFADLFKIFYNVPRMPDLRKEQFMKPFQAAYLNGRPAIMFCPPTLACAARAAMRMAMMRP